MSPPLTARLIPENLVPDQAAVRAPQSGLPREKHMPTCSVPSCDRITHTKGLCRAHYERLMVSGDVRGNIPLPPKQYSLCAVIGCSREADTRGFCASHYRRFLRTGDFTDQRLLQSSDLPETERFWACIDTSGGLDACWPWTGRLTKDGYGTFHESTQSDGTRATIGAHRKAFILTYGPIPSGHEIDHLCHGSTCIVAPSDCPHRRCCNPRHLEAVTHAENNRRSNSRNNLKKARAVQSAQHAYNRAHMTHCRRGHALTPDNIYIAPHAITRICRQCQSLLKKSRRQRAKKQML